MHAGRGRVGIAMFTFVVGDGASRAPQSRGSTTHVSSRWLLARSLARQRRRHISPVVRTRRCTRHTKTLACTRTPAVRRAASGGRESGSRDDPKATITRPQPSRATEPFALQPHSRTHLHTYTFSRAAHFDSEQATERCEFDKICTRALGSGSSFTSLRWQIII